MCVSKGIDETGHRKESTVEKKIDDKSCSDKTSATPTPCRSGSGSTPMIPDDHLAISKSSEGLRWMFKKLAKDEESTTQRKEPAPVTEDPGTNNALPTTQQKEGVAEEKILADVAGLLAKEPPTTAEEENDIQAFEEAQEGEPIAVRRGSPLPSAPSSPVDRQCVVLVCFSASVLCLLSLLAFIVVFSRWTSSAVHGDSAVTHGDVQPSRGSSRGDGSGCDSLFSFSHCAESDIFG